MGNGGVRFGGVPAVGTWHKPWIGKGSFTFLASCFRVRSLDLRNGGQLALDIRV